MPVTVRGLSDVTMKLHYMVRNLAPALKPTLESELTDIVSYIRSQKLSGQVLNIKTGSLYNSIGSYVSTHGARLTGQVYSRGVTYAGIHEFGGTTPPHLIVPRNANALHFYLQGGQSVFAAAVNHPGSKLPERSFIRSAVSERIEGVRMSLTRATRELLSL